MSAHATTGSDAVSVVVFDVNETLSDMAPLGRRFVDVGLQQDVAKLWFAMVLRDGFALTATDRSQPFARIAEGVLRGIVAGADPHRDAGPVVAHVMAGFDGLALHPDVATGVEGLASAGYRLVTLSNGAADVAEGLLARSGIRDRFERCLTVEDAGAWKPDRRAYLHAGNACGVRPAEMMLVASHPWDIDGAAHAGLRTAFVNRAAVPYPAHFTDPDLTVGALEHLAGRLGRAGTWTG